MAYLEELLPTFRNGAKIRQSYRGKDYFIQLKDGQIFNNYGSQYKFTSIDVLEDKWELYQEPIDWNYIIKNKCLCWFWDDDADIYTLGTLTKISDVADQFGDFKYKWNINGKYWKNCRPVCKDEVTFYEDAEK
nr:MAG TPA: hypothetical protein [Caudoviricetes sp.]